MAFENNVYEFPRGGNRQTVAEEPIEEQPTFLPADVGAETLDAYISFCDAEGLRSLDSSNCQRVREILETLSPVFVTEGERGIHQKLEEVRETLATGRPFERGSVVIQPKEAGAVLFALELIEMAREDKMEFLKWKNAQKNAEGSDASVEKNTETATFPTDAVGQFEVAIEYTYLNPHKNPSTENFAAALDTIYQLRPLLENSTEEPTQLLIRMIETIDAEDVFVENGINLTADALPALESVCRLSTFIDRNQEDLNIWYEQWSYPTTAVGRMEVAIDYLYTQTTNESARAKFAMGLDVINRLRPVFDSISGHQPSDALEKILQVLESGNNFERAGVLLTNTDLSALQTAYEIALFEEDQAEELQNWYTQGMQDAQWNAATSKTTAASDSPALTTDPSARPESGNNTTLPTNREDVETDSGSILPIAEDAEIKEAIPTIDQARDLERFIDYLTQTNNTEYPGVKDALARMRPVFENVGVVALADLLENIQAQIENGDTVEFAGVYITPEQSDSIATILNLLALKEQERDEFAAWKKSHPVDAGSDEEEYGDDSADALIAAGAAAASKATETALTETWKNQTRYFSTEMKKLQTEVINRRLTGLPHIFPPDFESIVGQFIYRLNRVTEFKPTMIAEFENEFTNLLEYFDLRMLRTAGEELDQELSDDPESLQRVDASLNTIDEQLTTLMLLQTNEPLIKELRNVKYRLDLLRGKINSDITAAQNAEEDQRQEQRLAA